MAANLRVMPQPVPLDERDDTSRSLAPAAYASDLHIVVDADGFVLQAIALSDFDGVRSDALIGERFVNLLHPDDRALAEQLLAKASLRHGGTARGELRLIRPDRKATPMGWLFRNALDVPGIGGIVIGAMDIGAILREHVAEAERRSNQAIGTFAGRLVHDFNNDCAAGLGFSRLLLEDLPTDSPYREYARHILAANEHCRAILDRIRQFAHAGRPPRRPEALAPIIERAAVAMRGTLPDGVTLRLSVGDRRVRASINAAAVERIILDLVDNASEAMDGVAGAIDIDLASVPSGDRDWRELLNAARMSSIDEDGAHDIHERIVGEPGPAKGYVRLTVTDYAGGFTAAALGHAFEPLFTTGNHKTRLGLSLATAAATVIHSGGACVLRTGAGGTSVELWLPLVDGDG